MKMSSLVLLCSRFGSGIWFRSQAIFQEGVHKRRSDEACEKLKGDLFAIVCY